VSAPQTPQEWEDAAEALAEWRAGRGPETFLHALGVDPQPLMDWCADDAVDTMQTVCGVTRADYRAGSKRIPLEMLGSVLATHAQMGLELGLWLVQQGRVDPR
jgi:hypothetical protein